MIAPVNSENVATSCFLVVGDRAFEEMIFLKTLHQFGSVLIRRRQQMQEVLRHADHLRLNITDVIVDITGMKRDAMRLCRSIHSAFKGCVPILLYSQQPIGHVRSLLRLTRAHNIVVGDSISPMQWRQLGFTYCRTQDSLPPDTGDSVEPVIWKELTLYPDRYCATLRGIPLNLSAGQFRILLHMVTHLDCAIPRRDLIEIGYGDDANLHEQAMRGIDNMVFRLRSSLGEYRSHVRTVRRVGYRFIGE